MCIHHKGMYRKDVQIIHMNLNKLDFLSSWRLWSHDGCYGYPDKLVQSKMDETACILVVKIYLAIVLVMF